MKCKVSYSIDTECRDMLKIKAKQMGVTPSNVVNMILIKCLQEMQGNEICVSKAMQDIFNSEGS